MEIKDFLKSHPAINVHYIEKILNLPTGTIRPETNRSIPDKYKDKIIDLLKRYDGERGGDNIVSIPSVKIEINKPGIINKGQKYLSKEIKLIKESDMRSGACVLVFINSSNLQELAKFPNGTTFYKEEIS
jgi:hypothetical protein